MATHPSAEKRHRQTVRRTLRNKRVLTAVRTALKQARSAIGAGNLQTAKATVSAAARALEKASSKGVLHARAASRTVSRIQTALHKLAKNAQ
jgi:small subunit ribosomal protein S20